MPICPYCGATVPEGAIACGKCGASLVSSQPQTSTTFQSQPDSSVNLQAPVPLHGQAET